jgi:hypothetical protein
MRENIRGVVWIFILIYVIACSGPGGNVASVSNWTYLQDKTQDSCTAVSTTCTVGLTSPTTAGSTIYLVQWSVGWTGSPLTISTVWFCTTNPCTSDLGGGTWITGFTPSVSISGGSPTHGLDLSYNLKMGGGSTYVTVTRNSGSTSQWGFELIEVLAPTGTSAALDAIGNSGTGSNSCSSCSGSSFSSFIGSNDAVLQTLDIDNTPSAVSAPYTLTSGHQWIYNLGSPTTAAPTFTQTPAGQAITAGLAFRAVSGEDASPDGECALPSRAVDATRGCRRKGDLRAWFFHVRPKSRTLPCVRCGNRASLPLGLLLKATN